MASYGKSIKWQDRWSGPVMTVTADGCDTMEEAERQAIALALERGWTAPKWWQFWRWNEPEVDLRLLNPVEKPILPGQNGP